MPSSIAHASLAVLLQPVLDRADRTSRLLGIGAVAAALPDIDAIGRPFGYGDVPWLGGHRALTHSLFAACLGAGAATYVVHRFAPLRSSGRAFFFLLIVIAAHGVLDAFTTYGSGIEFLAPFSTARFRAQWRPFDGLWPEVIALWLPALAVLAVVRTRRFAHP